MHDSKKHTSIASFLKGKRCLVMGLGLLGGGLATTRWLLKHGAHVTITDLKTARELAPSLRKLGRQKRLVRLVLGRHDEKDFKAHDLIIVNPDVPQDSPFLAVARRHGKLIENEASLFFRFCRNPIIGVTGTRGKTTTATWTQRLLKTRWPHAVLTGNVAQKAMLETLDGLDGKSPVVVELSSWQLELLSDTERSPAVAVVTNLYRDHLNRHRTMPAYARAKANLFKAQRTKDPLILNADNPWTRRFRSFTPRGKRLYFFSLQPLKPGLRGVWLAQNRVFSSMRGRTRSFGDISGFVRERGLHNAANLLAALTTAHAFGSPLSPLLRRVHSLPQIPFRQETVFSRANLMVVNDATSTTPEATMAAIERFKNENKSLFLIAGGTDKKLDFKQWAQAVKRAVSPQHLFLLKGSASKKMAEELRCQNFSADRTVRTLASLDAAWKTARMVALREKKKTVILFSPGATSFELFKNEFDRAKQFTALVHRSFKKRRQP